MTIKAPLSWIWCIIIRTRCYFSIVNEDLWPSKKCRIIIITVPAFISKKITNLKGRVSRVFSPLVFHESSPPGHSTNVLSKMVLIFVEIFAWTKPYAVSVTPLSKKFMIFLTLFFPNSNWWFTSKYFMKRFKVLKIFPRY